MTDYEKSPKQHDALISAEENRAMFDRIAGYYDGTNRILSIGLDAYWRRRGVAKLGAKPGGRYLDVGCGTGDIALEILRQSPQSTVVGIDPSMGMLALGHEKVQSAGLTHAISLMQGDALGLGFEDDTFDGAISSFCIRNVTHRKQALQEIRRVVRPGGSLVIVELTEPGGPIMRPLFRIYSRVVMPSVTKVMSSVPAYRYLTDSMADFPRPSVFAELMADAGFVNMGFAHLTFGIVTLFWGQVPLT